MKISKQARRDAKSLFAACRPAGVLDDAKVRKAVTDVIAQKPRGYVGVLSHFQRLVRLDVERRAARVESATVLTPATQAALSQNLARRHGPGLQLSFEQNPALIGGLRIQVGSDVYDGSVAARLHELSESF
ncbi:MAG: F0F1 ATP synthase subunit delta [Verrucomicrobia bacterium]|nr:F0F1 ATP synthase subunit delta [Verrucomicrobiota bacterium]